MKTIVIFVLAFITVATCLNLRTKTTYPFYKLDEFAQSSDYAKVLTNFVNLHLSTGGKLDEVIKFVKEAGQKTKDDRVNLNTLFQSEMARLQGQIESLEKSINSMKSDLDSTKAEIKALNLEINLLTISISGLQEQIAAITLRESVLTQARNNDLDAFTKRQLRDKNAIAGLEQIIPALKQLQSGGAAMIQKSDEEITEGLKLIPKNDPIAKLVQVSKKFNAVKLEEVVNKLTTILEAIKASKDQDEKSEEASKLTFDRLMAEITKSRTAAQAKLNSDVIAKGMAEANLIVAQGKRVSLESGISKTELLLVSAKETKDSSEVSFKARLVDADKAIEALDFVYNLLTENEAKLSNVEQNSDGLFAKMF